MVQWVCVFFSVFILWLILFSLCLFLCFLLPTLLSVFLSVFVCLHVAFVCLCVLGWVYIWICVCVCVCSWPWSWPSSMAALCLCLPHHPCCLNISWACGSTAAEGGDMCVLFDSVWHSGWGQRSEQSLRLCMQTEVDGYSFIRCRWYDINVCTTRYVCSLLCPENGDLTSWTRNSIFTESFQGKANNTVLKRVCVQRNMHFLTCMHLDKYSLM